MLVIDVIPESVSSYVWVIQMQFNHPECPIFNHDNLLGSHAIIQAVEAVEDNALNVSDTAFDFVRVFPYPRLAKDWCVGLSIQGHAFMVG